MHPAEPICLHFRNYTKSPPGRVFAVITINVGEDAEIVREFTDILENVDVVVQACDRPAVPVPRFSQPRSLNPAGRSMVISRECRRFDRPRL